VDATISSFTEETDPEVLSVEAARIEIVRLEWAEPFGSFLERHPSSISAEEVALLNQVEPDGVLSEGFAKRVVGGRARER
ncbi:MAG: hypothetical protein RQ745_11655, partial [Longimicrobiales bacterium]|nr:hypothetical protein [Longimicrobiales bacterium]